MRGRRSSRGLNPVPLAELLAIVRQRGARIIDLKSGWYRIEGDLGVDRRLCLNQRARKTLCTDVHLSGFLHELGIPHPNPPTGRVRQRLDFTQDEDLIIKDFERVLEDGLFDPNSGVTLL